MATTTRDMESPAAVREPAGPGPDVAEFWRTGFLVMRGVFARDEMAVVRDAIATNPLMQAHARDIAPRAGEGARLSFHTLFVWNDAGQADLFSKVTRARRLIEPLEAIFRERVYVYHNKVALKYPGVVGFDFHQDYAYWYHMGVVYPDMATVFIAVDAATVANGCLRLVAGSHRLGRLEHVNGSGDFADSGVDPERLAQVRARMPTVAIELDPGDVVIFHCNTLHASSDNLSGASRIAILGCYNTMHNSPFKSTYGHPGYRDHPAIAERITAADLAHLPHFAEDSHHN